MGERISVGDNEVELYYEDVGDGPPLTLLHGFSGNHLSWWQQVPTFADDYRCLVPDQRRFGLSRDTAGVGVSAFPDDLADLLDTLGIERTAVVGHSMGGWTATSFATQYPERVSALVLSATPGGLIPSDRHEELMAVAETPTNVDPLTPEAAFLADAIAGLNIDAPPSWGETRPVLDALPVDHERIVDADIPVLLVAGEADEFMPGPAVSELADLLGAETAVVENAGHSVFYEQPTAFNGRVGAFLDDQDLG